jgi:hypothetical protein
MSHAVPLSNCANCEAPLSGHYCANCGQEAVLHQASTREFLHEFIGHYVALEGKLWGSLRRLILKPGELTNEYMRGRRVRYVQPLRLYLTFSVLFFALLKFTGGDSDLEIKVGAPATATATAPTESASAAPPAAPAAAQHGDKALQTDKNDNISEEYISEKLSDWPMLRHQWEAFSHLPAEQQLKAFRNGMLHYAPYAIFCLMPVFALLLKMLYLGSGRKFGEHMLFALHTNAFAFVIFSTILLVQIGLLQFLLWCWLIAYLPWAMRRVYHSGRFSTFLRWAVLMLAYVIALALAVAVSAGMGILTLGH